MEERLVQTNEIAAPSSSTVSNKHKQQQQGVRIATMRTRFGGTYNEGSAYLNQRFAAPAAAERRKKGLICTNEIAAPSSSTERIGGKVSNKHKQQ